MAEEVQKKEVDDKEEKHEKEEKYDTVYDDKTSLEKMDSMLNKFKVLRSEKDINSKFFKLLKDCGALIAGGGVLDAIHENDVMEKILERGKQPNFYTYRLLDVGKKDIDIYVSATYIEAFIKGLLELIDIDNYFLDIKEPSLYCKSFLNKNGIKLIFNIRHKRRDPRDSTPPDTPRKKLSFQSIKYEIDIMVVRNRRTPLQVVNNFDLSFCQTWFDGERIYASYKEDVLTKNGTLQGEYIPLYLEGNFFLKRRIDKYAARGYTIRIHDKEYASYKDGFIIRKPNEPNITKKKSMKCFKYDDKTLLMRWVSHVLLKWVIGVRDNVKPSPDIDKPEEITWDNILALPLRSSTTSLYMLDAFGGKPSYHRNVCIPPPDTAKGYMQQAIVAGYDSEDYDITDTINAASFITSNNNYGGKEKEIENMYIKNEKLITLFSKIHKINGDAAILAYYRSTNLLLLLNTWEINEYVVECLDGFAYNTKTLYKLIKELDLLQRMQFGENENKYKKFDPLLMTYYNALKERCLRHAYCSGCNTIKSVYDFHEHSLDEAFCGDCLKRYINDFKLSPNKTQVKCIVPGCKKYMTFPVVKYIVSNEYYEQYIKPVPINPDLTNTIELYTTILENTKKPDPVGFGAIFEEGICPYCLTPASRAEGCAYITHKNISGPQDTNYPHCEPAFLNVALRNKYREVGRELMRNEYGQQAYDMPVHLEFCIECGRPCVGHKHLTEKAPYTYAPSKTKRTRYGILVDDYGTCAGGERPELYARILVIRKYYEDNKDSALSAKEKRDAASNAADDYSTRQAMMPKARAIFAKAIAERKWNNNAPANVPANASDIQEGAHDAAAHAAAEIAPIVDDIANAHNVNFGNANNEQENNQQENNQQGGGMKFAKTRKQNKKHKSIIIRKTQKTMKHIAKLSKKIKLI
uniref:Uncharacterized protein n=1 Tax=viral metagenome TaxID=1070528 RepID=A0A6C0IH90_9ZZZZ